MTTATITQQEEDRLDSHAGPGTLTALHLVAQAGGESDADGDPQRRAALAKANQVRLARAQLRRRIAEGDVSAANVILEAPHEADSWAVWEVLVSQRRWGASKARKFLSSNNISETKRVGQLTPRQRQLLASQLSARGVRRVELV
jgi:hypothetical protein